MFYHKGETVPDVVVSPFADLLRDEPADTLFWDGTEKQGPTPVNPG